MVIGDAIDLSKAAAEDMDLQDMPRFAEAVRQGTQALKRLKEIRERMKTPYVATEILLLCVKPLPGETQASGVKE